MEGEKESVSEYTTENTLSSIFSVRLERKFLFASKNSNLMH
jgi:hypothetical protein